jgi:hypothetical protein
MAYNDIHVPIRDTRVGFGQEGMVLQVWSQNMDTAAGSSVSLKSDGGTVDASTG